MAQLVEQQMKRGEICSVDSGVEQRTARRVHYPEAAGSNPASATNHLSAMGRPADRFCCKEAVVHKNPVGQPNKVRGAGEPPTPSTQFPSPALRTYFYLTTERMAKDVIISTESVNSYGSRVLTSGIDLEQYKRNPVLLWMHRRSWEQGAMPIGRVENLRVEDGKLIGTPVFDQNDDFAKQIESKWENGFLRMASAGLEPIETTPDPALALPGQTRATVTRSKLIEVSIVDIGGNDDALQLCGSDGKVLKLAAGEECPELPLLQQRKETNPAPEKEPGEGEEKNNHKKEKSTMNKEQLTLLGLPEGASDEQATAALQLMKTKADSADSMQQAAVEQCVDQAIAERKIVAAQRDHFIKLGKTAGVLMLSDTFKGMTAQQKPGDVINPGKDSAPGAGGRSGHDYKKLSEVPETERLELRKNNPGEYMRLYKEEYGMECPTLTD